MLLYIFYPHWSLSTTVLYSVMGFYGLVVILIVYSIFKNKRTQQSLLVKDSEITGLNSKIEDMNKIYSENMKQLQLQNQLLREHLNHVQNHIDHDVDNHNEDLH